MAETLSKKQTPVRKASQTSEAVIGTAANTLKKAAAVFTEGMEQLNTIHEKVEELQLSIASKEEQLAQLEQDFKEKERQLTVELEISLKAAEEKKVFEYLESKGLEAISKEELYELKREIQDVINTADANIKKEVAIVTNKLTRDAENEKKLLEATYQTKEADNRAKISSMLEKITFLEAQLKEWQNALAEERKAGVDRAKAGAIGSINLASPGK